MSTRTIRRAHARRAHKSGSRRFAAAVAGAAVAITVAPGGAEAKTFRVTSGKDDGPRTLRKAVARAAEHHGPDRVAISRHVHGDIRLRNDLVVRTSVTIDGPGRRGPDIYGLPPRRAKDGYPAISSNGKKDHDPKLKIRDLDLNSVAIGAGEGTVIEDVHSFGRPKAAEDLGNAIGVYDVKEATVRRARITGSWSTGIDASYSGDVHIANSKISDLRDYGIEFFYADGSVEGTTISGNGGPGLIIDIGHVDVERSTVSGNGGSGISAGYYGGATVKRSTISANEAENGGGIYVSDYGGAWVRNSTISGNEVTGSEEGPGSGGGIFLSGGGELEISASTVTGNTAAKGGGVYLYNPYADEPVTVESSILAGNHAAAGPDCLTTYDGPYPEPAPPDEMAPISKGGNVFGPEGCAATVAGDVTAADPGLGPLADNGGPTLTHGLLPGSPAIGQGLDLGLKTDQRGVKRDADPDSGAFEWSGAP
jgi:hypothetical protein